ncbi:MAG: hypothetical protein JST87_05285 [Bacteroidetes bacterium]|nr:hypothetical protein [Bacteroidota bacterium]
MPFTDRYIKVPIKLYNASEEDLMGKKADDCEMIQIELRLNPFKIEDYYPAIAGEEDFDEANLNTTRIIMESGEKHLAYMNIDQFEKLLNDSQQH